MQVGQNEHSNAYAILKELLHVTSPFIREGFLAHSVQAMSRLFGADLAFVARVLDTPASRVRVLAAWQGGAQKEGWDFALSGTPCDLIYDASKIPETGVIVNSNARILIREGLCDKFFATRKTNFQSFIGVPLWNRQHKMVGHIAVFFEECLHDDDRANRILEIMQVLGHRIEAELDRMLLEEEMFNANEELQRVNAQLLTDSITDPLTQVANRRYFNQRCKEAFARFQRLDEPYFLLLLDIDHFKAINDSYGHDVGDQALKALVDNLAHNLRADVEVLARLGGEEFAVVCHGVEQAEAAAALSERMRTGIAECPIVIGGHAIHVTVSIGVAGPNRQDMSWEDAYRRADQALYAAKTGGRNRVCVAPA